MRCRVDKIQRKGREGSLLKPMRIRESKGKSCIGGAKVALRLCLIIIRLFPFQPRRSCKGRFYGGRGIFGVKAVNVGSEKELLTPRKNPLSAEATIIACSREGKGEVIYLYDDGTKPREQND